MLSSKAKYAVILVFPPSPHSDKLCHSIDLAAVHLHCFLVADEKTESWLGHPPLHSIPASCLGRVPMEAVSGGLSQLLICFTRALPTWWYPCKSGYRVVQSPAPHQSQGMFCIEAVTLIPEAGSHQRLKSGLFDNTYFPLAMLTALIIF